MKRKENKIDDIVKSRFFRLALKKGVAMIGNKNKLVNLGLQVFDKLDKGENLQSVGADFLNQVRLLARLIQFSATRKYRQISPKTMVLIIGAVIYFVSPLDLVPDFIPLLGYADDVTLLAWIFTAVGKEIADFEVFYKQYLATAEIDYIELEGKEKS